MPSNTVHSPQNFLLNFFASNNYEEQVLLPFSLALLPFLRHKKEEAACLFSLSTGMKKSGIFAASVAAASATVISASSSPSTSTYDYNYDPSSEERKEEDNNGNGGKMRSGSRDKFAPRFDGLRFIETLVTAHR